MTILPSAGTQCLSRWSGYLLPYYLKSTSNVLLPDAHDNASACFVQLTTTSKVVLISNFNKIIKSIINSLCKSNFMQISRIIVHN